MANKRLPVRKIREVLRLRHAYGPLAAIEVSHLGMMTSSYHFIRANNNLIGSACREVMNTRGVHSYVDFRTPAPTPRRTGISR